jgi:outer membrane lipoprotein-sorting protein
VRRRAGRRRRGRSPGLPRAARLTAALVAVALAGAAAAAELEPAPAGLDGRSVARRAEDALRSEHTIMEAEMTVRSPRLSSPRAVTFRSWDDRPGKRSFIRILQPAKDAGTGFLKLESNLWMYVPRVERTMRIPPSMMLQSWMGSDFTNDDLVRESSALDDYSQKLLGVDPAPEGHPGLRAYVVEYLPHEDAPVVWGKIVAWIEVQHGTPLRQDFYDEDGTRLRTMRFDDIRPVGGRYFPFLWVMTPLDQKGHETSIRIHSIEFDADIDATVFTKRNLTKVR